VGSEAVEPEHPQAPGRPLGLAHAPAIESCLGPWRAALSPDCPSDFCFSNLYLFRATHAYRVIEGDWPCITGLTYDGVRHVLALFDLANAPLHVLQELLVGHDCFYPVAAGVAQELDGSKFESTWHEADADYLYPADNFRHYKGRLLAKKKNQLRQLLAQGDIQACPLTPAHLHNAQQVLTQWLHDKHKQHGEADDDACRQALHLQHDLNLVGTVFYLRDQAIGFVIVQRLSSTVAVVRFAKGLAAHTGIYPFMFQHVCLAWPELQWLNFEQDLGLPNFRQTKRSYQPGARIEKYRVRLRP
jgi:uncharacterized protein